MKILVTIFHILIDFIYFGKLLNQIMKIENDDLYFEEKYRISSARLKGWDYRNPALYFIRIKDG